MRILVTGKNGQVGYELTRSLASLGTVISASRQQFDLAQPGSLIQKLEQLKPDIIINAAAYTAVDKAEQDKNSAFMINAQAPERLAHYAAKHDIPLIHFSTDYVFDGKKQAPWRETDIANPLGVYGMSKLEGEQGIESQQCKHLILRTSWVYGLRGHNFFNTMKRLANEKQQLSVVDDQFGSPTWSRHLADVTAQLVCLSRNTPDFWQNKSGIYHVSAQGKTSWYGFAAAIFEQMQKQGMTVPSLEAIATSSYPTPATRPENSCLDNTKLRKAFNLQLPDWQQTLSLMFE